MGLNLIGGAPNPPAASVFSSGSLICAGSGAFTTLAMDSERFDTDNIHFTSGAALTGTVQKTASSTAVVGTGTAFTTELTVGQVISVPGTATEQGVVATITDATHLTVAANFANSASGQTATRLNTALVCRTPGRYRVWGVAGAGVAATARAMLSVQKNGTTEVARGTSGSSGSAEWAVYCELALVQWDYVELRCFNGGAGNLTLTNQGAFSINFGMSYFGV